MRRVVAGLILLLGLPLSIAACTWDRDTPLQEGRNKPDVVSAILGRFDRNPPLYYEMRLARVEGSLRAHPEDLAAYDDAGVACDRLGRGDEAVAWMEKKRERLDALDPHRAEVKEALYRYHANLGTFLVHRWSRQGADRSRIDEVKQARDEIARALEINPDAHFGREKYQLMALEWILDPPPMEQYDTLPVLFWSGAKRPKWLPSGPGPGPHNTKPLIDARAASNGLAGLIILGNAWESVDVFNSLAYVLYLDEQGSLSRLAVLRARELIDAGKGSMLPGAPAGVPLKGRLFRPEFVKTEALDEAYPKLRAEAESRHARRTAYMMERLNAGRHPDTDPKFWDDYRPRPFTDLPDYQTKPEARHERWRLAGGVGAAGTAAAGLIAWGFIRAARRRRKPAPAEVTFLA